MHLPSAITQKVRELRSLVARHSTQSDPTTTKEALTSRLVDVFLRTWDLGFTAFGGPPVHFQILYQRFVEGKGGKEKWVDEQTYQELFAICQGLPGPASTKMLFCLSLVNAGIIPAILAFILWSLPGAIGMYGLALGVQQIGDTLPPPVYALLSGLNAATVGIIALAAVQLAEKAIKDKLTRILVIFGACAGMCYNALWFFPLVMTIGGITSVVWDGWLRQSISRLRARIRRRKRTSETEEQNPDAAIPLESRTESLHGLHRRTQTSEPRGSDASGEAIINTPDQAPDKNVHTVRIRVGVLLTASFFASFTAVLVVRGHLGSPPLAFDLFAKMYLAGTTIFGGGPVVIPLLRTYVVDPGWVSGRDFLLGLAIIQAFPGPNFNFAVYLGALTLQNTDIHTIFGALVAFVGIFTPGLTLAVAVQGFWRVLRKKKWVLDLLRGLNATAVGLVFTAVYRLWEIGYLTPAASQGQSLAREPWWVVVAAVTYAQNAWFNVPAAFAIISGGVLGLCWYGAVGR